MIMRAIRTPAIIGHRGAAGLAPENTLQSIRRAIRLECDATELDVRLTRDGIPVVVHDKTVDRTTDGKGEVANLTMAEVMTFRCSNGECIPSLTSAIDVCHGRIAMFVELKDNEVVSIAAELIRRRSAQSMTTFSSFNPLRLVAAKQICKRSGTCLLRKRLTDEKMHEINDSDIGVIGLPGALVTKKIVDRVHDSGKRLYAYHVNTLALGERLTVLGVDQIGTDFPDQLITLRYKTRADNTVKSCRDHTSCFSHRDCRL